MNFLEIISAHVRWKQRLRDYIQNKAEPLDPASIGRDDQCTLGKWIYGEGQTFAQALNFEKVRVEHAAFHKHAAAVITFVNRGDCDLATQVLNGEYARVSNHLKRDISPWPKRLVLTPIKHKQPNVYWITVRWRTGINPGLVCKEPVKVI